LDSNIGSVDILRGTSLALYDAMGVVGGLHFLRRLRDFVSVFNEVTDLLSSLLEPFLHQIIARISHCLYWPVIVQALVFGLREDAPSINQSAARAPVDSDF
jgi:hypothetical protein